MRTNRRKIWRYNQAEWESANAILSSTNWNNYLTGDVDQAWIKWKDRFMSVMEECIPQSTLPDKCNLLWLNREITKSMRARNLAFRRAKRSKNPNHWNVYKRKWNDVANKLKYAKKKFFSHLTPSNPKSFWKTTKVLTKGVSRIPFLKDDSGKIITDDTTFNSCVAPLSESDRLIFSNLTSSDCPSELLCTEEQVLELLLTLDTSYQGQWS